MLGAIITALQKVVTKTTNTAYTIHSTFNSLPSMIEFRLGFAQEGQKNQPFIAYWL